MSDELCLAELMDRIGSLFSSQELCKLSPEQKLHYEELLERFEEVNTRRSSADEKGKALEELATYLLQISGNIFKVIRNVRTNSNEIDQFITLNEKGLALCSAGLISSRFRNFLGECKNYRSKVGVTYVGKFYSLLQTTSITTGILFSYHGITGQNWNDASGLVKKIYLQRECESNRTVIINFDRRDFVAISNGQNFLDIIDSKLCALQLDTSINSYISAHPAESILAEQ